jgi:hypothetical protein
MQRRLDEEDGWKACSLINGALWRLDYDTAAAEDVTTMTMRRKSYTRETPDFGGKNVTQQPQLPLPQVEKVPPV